MKGSERQCRNNVLFASDGGGRGGGGGCTLIDTLCVCDLSV